MMDALGRYQIPGAAVAVVSGEEVVLLKGYGFADVERRIPVDPERTVFRAFSVSKPVTATAVMQLFDRGLLKPDDDVTRHLEGLPLRRAFPQPITAGQLLTHTSGFTDRGAGTVALHPENVKTLEQYLADRPYRQVDPPGQRVAYSDYNFALAGYLVERVSGLPFPRFAEETVFRPLGMSRTTFLQPRPGVRVPEHAVGYAHAGGRYEPQPPA
ncbi:MAG: serine hydrolase domain-containing protein, partial [Bacillota bacterium]|nr:serine hydrolase domain-containing protein [Bacillota bacterium]